MRGALASALVLALGLGTEAVQTAPRRVLVLQTMNRGNLVYDNFTTEFRAALQMKAADITLFDFVVAPAGATEAPERPVIDYLQSVYAGCPPLAGRARPQ